MSVWALGGEREAMSPRHRCPECGWVHASGEHQRDRAISGALVGFALALILTHLAGCEQRARDSRPDYHPGGNAVERMVYCARAHSGAHLPEDQEGCEQW